MTFPDTFRRAAPRANQRLAGTRRTGAAGHGQREANWRRTGGVCSRITAA